MRIREKKVLGQPFTLLSFSRDNELTINRSIDVLIELIYLEEVLEFKEGSDFVWIN
jgi:hypothetical protein